MTTSIRVLAPLGAGLLIIGSLAPLSFELEREALPPADQSREPPRIEIGRMLEEDIPFEPAKTAFLETVVLQGGVGDRKAAVRELGNLGTPDAVAVLSLALADEDERVRNAAMETLSDIGSDDALAAIASATRSEDAAVRARAAEAIAGTDGYSAVDYLDLVLQDDDPRVRAAVVGALGDIGDSRSINIISTALRDPDPRVREQAAEVLAYLDEEALFRALYPHE